VADESTTPRRRQPWEYPYDYAEDPAGEADRREFAEAERGHEAISVRSVSAHWQRRADHAKAWLEANPEAPQDERDKAYACQVSSLRNAATAGGMKAEPAALDLERLHEATENPLYMWAAVFRVLYDAPHDRGPERAPATGGEAGPVTIPAWCVAPLRAAVARLLGLGLAGLPPATSENVARALGLISQGYNAYKMRERETRERGLAGFLAELEAAGLPPQRARKVAFPQLSDADALRRAARRVARAAKPPQDD
jgi:hypothetical protein